jgi:Transposase domain (DUF772)
LDFAQIIAGATHTSGIACARSLGAKMPDIPRVFEPFARDRARTPGLRIATNELPPTVGHPFYQRLNQVLDTHGLDEFVEAQCASFYAATRGRPSLTPGTYFRLLLIGYFEGIDSERGIAWRTADSLALRGFLGLGLHIE